MKKAIKLSLVALSMALIGGCTTEPTVNIDRTGSHIDEIKTQYTTVLERTNTMIQVFNGIPINVAVVPIENKTAARGKLPADITEIVKSSFINIGEFVRVISDTTVSEGAKDFIYIAGAITEFDVVSSKDKGVNAAGTGTVGKRHNRWDADGSLDSEEQTIKLGITLNPSKSTKGDYISKASTRNTVTIEKKSSANEFAFSILGSGFGFNNAVTKSQGIHASIRVLVELSVAEVLGKIGKFPYWLLLQGGKVNYDIVNHLSHKFLREPVSKKIELISYLLVLHGKDIKVTRLMNDQLKQAIIEYKREHGLPADESLSKKFYISLLNP
jgi:hypothetical protein